jgi:hypothetical protein
MSIRTRMIVLALLLLGAEAQSLAVPANVDAAKHAFFEGVQHYRGGHFAEALASFERSYELNPVPAVLHNIGLTHKALGQYRESIDAFTRYLREAGAQPGGVTPERRAEVERAIAEARSHLAPPPREEPAQRPSEPATTATTPATTATTPAIAPAATTPATPRPLPAWMARLPSARSRRGLASIVVGVTSFAALVTWAATGEAALGKRRDYDRTCNSGQCNQSLYDSGRSMAIASDVFLGIGLVGVAVTTALVLVPPREHRLALTPAAGPSGGGLTLTGRF